MDSIVENRCEEKLAVVIFSKSFAMGALAVHGEVCA